MLEQSDFSVVVKNRAPPPSAWPSPWQWEIYRAGRTSPIDRSRAFFTTMSAAERAGTKALRSMLSDYPD
jgi:hypothetical protein